MGENEEEWNHDRTTDSPLLVCDFTKPGRICTNNSIILGGASTRRKMEGTDQIVVAGSLGHLRRNPQAAGPGGQVENVLKFLDMAEETESGLVEWRVERKEE